MRFVLLTSPNLDSATVRGVLRTMWSPEGAWGLWVTGNPEKKGYGENDEREGVDSEYVLCVLCQVGPFISR